MSVNQLSDSAQNYLKIIFSLKEWSDEPVTPSFVAERAGVKLSTVSGALAKLRQLNLLDHAPYGEITLTDTGRAYALAMVRRHRLIETFLVQMLGYRWDQVHDEAENLEHAVSDFMIERIDELLGHPTRDPHGDPIPSAAGQISMPTAHPLGQAVPGSTVVVERISDADSQLLQYFSENGIVLGARLSVFDGDPYSDTVEITAEPGSPRVVLGARAADAVWVSGTEQ
ncbi:metal-dependent transcriptional regulator [Glutamicibacter sp. MNS18]|uniref:metal-dependent transcriptional regulator n=1 Tax=Glutamicibacter sp. MNS18 TaxID=2989817 RepID=UPI0022355EE8|nr:metal-dependent transcriptional regulator [Glutamicibacter sp. MNS18]MCW4465738.1 metal-dependent transcriptional regulator [Glutamicibacter sp. MNS18]